MKNETIQVIYKAISDARGEDYQAVVSQRNFITNNCKFPLIWDLLNENIADSLRSSNFEVAITGIGSWKFILILDKENNTLYSLMNEKRYQDIMKAPQKAPKYMRALTLLNEKLGYVTPRLFDLDESDNNKEFGKVLHKLCNSFSSENDFKNITYNIITFSIYENLVSGLYLKTLDNDLGLLDEINLTDSMKPIYSNEIEQITKMEIAEQPVKLTLKKKAEERKGEKEKISIKEISKTNQL